MLRRSNYETMNLAHLYCQYINASALIPMMAPGVIVKAVIGRLKQVKIKNRDGGWSGLSATGFLCIRPLPLWGFRRKTIP